MRIEFEGSVEEFCRLFSGTSAPSVVATKEGEDKSVASSPTSPVYTRPVYTSLGVVVERNLSHDEIQELVAPSLPPDFWKDEGKVWDADPMVENAAVGGKLVKENIGPAPSARQVFTPSRGPLIDSDADKHTLSSGSWSTAEAPSAPPPPSLTIAVTPMERKLAWDAFCGFVQTWVQGFEDAEAEQSDRLDLMRTFGSGSHTVGVLVMAYELGSLQELVWRALMRNARISTVSVDFADRVAATMVQVSHMAAPELAGTYNYGSKWRARCANRYWQTIHEPEIVNGGTLPSDWSDAVWDKQQQVGGL